MVCPLYCKQRLGVHQGILHQSEFRTIHQLDSRPWPADLLFPARLAASDVSMDLRSDLGFEADVQQERPRPAVVGGGAFCVFLSVRVQIARIHSADGTADRDAARK